ncbi:MAG: anthranilate phosphoribosyltransferase [Candidatus Korobacteraceae bacterium]
MILDALQRVAVRRESLPRDVARAVMSQILRGEASDAQIAGLLVALHMKGEGVEEIVGFAEAMRAAAVQLPIPQLLRQDLLDTCGTGGDACGTFNISTATALVVAGGGVRVAKHGNRSITSKCGSADVMEALGVSISIPPERLVASLEQVGLAFLFAPALHSATRFVQPARRELKIRTVFNLLGPLTNPAGASAQIVGVYSATLVPMLAEALRCLGVKHAMVVHGSDGLDEISLSGPTSVAELRDDAIRTFEVAPEQFGFQRAPLDAIVGGDAAANAQIIRELLEGRRSPHRDIVVLNAAAAFTVAGKADSIQDAIPLAEQAIDSGAARSTLERLKLFSSGVAHVP